MGEGWTNLQKSNPYSRPPRELEPKCPRASSLAPRRGLERFPTRSEVFYNYHAVLQGAYRVRTRCAGCVLRRGLPAPIMLFTKLNQSGRPKARIV